MAKFYVVGVTKYDPTINLYDVTLKFQDGEIEGDLRIQVEETEVSTWVSKIGKYSDEFELLFS